MVISLVNMFFFLSFFFLFIPAGLMRKDEYVHACKKAKQTLLSWLDI